MAEGVTNRVVLKKSHEQLLVMSLCDGAAVLVHGRAQHQSQG